MELHVGIEPTSDAYKTTALAIELMELLTLWTLCTLSIHRVSSSDFWILVRKLSKLPQLPSLAAGTPYESRTHVTAVKEQCLDRLTNGAYKRHYRSSHALVVHPSFFKLGASCMSSLKLIKWLSALLLGVHSTSAITTSRLEGLRSGLPKTHPTILLNATHSQCPRKIGCDNKRSRTWLQEINSLCYLLSHGIITIFWLILSLDYIEDYIIQIKICQEGICSLQ